MGKLACLFPGQGSQSVGMGLDLFNQFEKARETFELVDKVAGRSLSKLCFEGDEAQLKRTLNTQPTILAASLAAWSAYLSLGGPEPHFVAGHSLGEITALTAAQSIKVEEAVTLVEKRASLMESCPEGAMSAVLGVSQDVLEKLTGEAHDELLAAGSSESEATVVVANFNTRDQLVISGSPGAVSKAGEKARGAGGRVIALSVGGAFHSPLMLKAAQEFALELDRATIKDALFPVVQNFDARPSRSSPAIKDKLARQMSHAVRWLATIEFMLSEGVDTFIEIGPGKVLAGTVKKIDKTAKIYNVFDAVTLKSTLAALKQVPV